jgi:hypothetical protein
MPNIYSTAHFVITWDIDPRLLTNSTGRLVLFGKDFGALQNNNVPLYIQAVGLILEAGFNAYVTRFQFRNPCNLHPTDVQVANLHQSPNDATAGLGAYNDTRKCGEIFLQYDLTDEVLVSALLHEFFHVVEGRYHPVSGTQSQPAEPEARLWSEGCAKLAPDFVVDSINNWMGPFNGGFLANPARLPLSQLGYDASGIWRFLLEQCAAPATDDSALAEILQRCWVDTVGPAPLSAQLLSTVMDHRAPRGITFARIQRTLPGGLDVMKAETLLGDFLVAVYLQSVADSRFAFAEQTEPPGLYGLHPNSIATVTPSQPFSDTTNLAPWQFRFYAIMADPALGMVRFKTTLGGGAKYLVMLVTDPRHNVIATDRTVFERTLPVSDFATGCAVLAIIGLPGQTGQLQVNAEAAASVPDLILTRANCAVGCDYERNPFNWPWDDVTPDIDLGSPGAREFDVLAQGPVTPVSVHVHNHGLVAGQAKVKLFWQRTSSLADVWDTAWEPVRDKAATDPTGREQEIAITVPARNDATATAMWYVEADSRPIPSHPPKGVASKQGPFRGQVSFALRAVVECAEDGSPDNNAAIQLIRIWCRCERRKKKPNVHTRPKRQKPPRPPPKKKKRPVSKKKRVRRAAKKSGRAKKRAAVRSRAAKRHR